MTHPIPLPPQGLTVISILDYSHNLENTILSYQLDCVHTANSEEAATILYTDKGKRLSLGELILKACDLFRIPYSRLQEEPPLRFA